MRRIVLGDNAEVLPALPAAFAPLVYVDPPFNTGRTQQRDRMRVRATRGEGSRGGFGGKRYDVERVASSKYADQFDDLPAFLIPRIESALRCTTR
jgi:site-specific DNA-methyltransferase (adenine-specific)